MSEKLAATAFFVGALVVIAAVWIVISHYEAAAFYRLTGKRVSTADAMFLELRVQEPVQADTTRRCE